MHVLVCFSLNPYSMKQQESHFIRPGSWTILDTHGTLLSVKTQQLWTHSQTHQAPTTIPCLKALTFFVAHFSSVAWKIHNPCNYLSRLKSLLSPDLPFIYMYLFWLGYIVKGSESDQKASELFNLNVYIIHKKCTSYHGMLGKSLLKFATTE